MSFYYDRFLRARSDFEGRHYGLIAAGMGTPQHARYKYFCQYSTKLILADAANREAEGRLSARPKGAHSIGQCSVATLGTDLGHCRRAAPCLARLSGLCTRQYQLGRVRYCDRRRLLILLLLVGGNW